VCALGCRIVQSHIGCRPSLLLLLRLLRRNFIYSLVAGGAVLGAIALAITAVSNFDPVKRG
jgi:hypothetical protein